MKFFGSTVFLLLLTWGSLPAQLTTQVIPGHWSYDLLRRYRIEGYAPGIHEYASPLPRAAFLRLSRQLMKLSEEGVLSTLDRKLLGKLLAEYEPELNDRGTWLPYESEGKPRRGQYHLVNTYADDYRLILDPVLELDAMIDDDSRSDDLMFNRRQATGFALRGRAGETLHFYLYFTDTRLVGDKTYDTLSEIEDRGVAYVSFEDGEANFDRLQGGMSFRSKWFDAHVLRSPVTWGPSPFDNLLFTDYAPAFEQVKLEKEVGAVKFSFLTGALKSEESGGSGGSDTGGGDGRTLKSRKIAAHRISVKPHRRLELAFTEVVVYGGRGWELGYSIPVLFYWSEQHNLGDFDNTLWGFDGAWLIMNGYRAYMSLLVDDFSLSKYGSNWFGNKWAVQAGLELTNIAGITGLDGSVEYTRVEPYVFTHYVPVNVYRNDQRGLGFPTGPNSDQLRSELRYWVNARLFIEGGLRYTRHGANPPGINVGGDINVPRRPGDADTKSFLAGIEEKSLCADMGISFEVLPEVYLRASARYSRFDNYVTEDTTRGDFNSTRIGVEFSYRYY